MLNIDNHFVSDYGANGVPEQRGIFVYETPDEDIPNLVNVTLDLGTGVLQIIADETLDFTPVSSVVFENMTLANVTGDRRIVLVGATVEPRDRAIIFMSLTEAQRCKLLKYLASWAEMVMARSSNLNGALRDVALNCLQSVVCH